MQPPLEATQARAAPNVKAAGAANNDYFLFIAALLLLDAVPVDGSWLRFRLIPCRPSGRFAWAVGGRFADAQHHRYCRTKQALVSARLVPGG